MTIDFEPAGAIFDVDDTLLDNKPGIPGQGLHERSRLAAVHEVGRRHGIDVLAGLSADDNLEAFLSAPVHTLEAAVWNVLRMTGIADSDVINPENPLLQEIVRLKNEKHEYILLEYGEEVPGSTAFVCGLADHGLAGRLAIASTAVRRDIDLYLEKAGLQQLFPSERIKSKEDCQHFKPHPQVFDLAFESLGLTEAERARTCAFDDDPRGLMAARAAGLYVCAITTRFSRQELQSLEIAPDLIADSYEEFASVFGFSL